MNSVLPTSAEENFSRTGLVPARDALLDDLSTGDWKYPETKAGAINLSFVFDVIAAFALIVLTAYNYLGKQNPSPNAYATTGDQMIKAIRKFCKKQR